MAGAFLVRIIAGSARGRTLRVPKVGTRPTSDRVRESVFASLDAYLADWSGLQVLDLYAGSGALGLEALSRGAAELVAVDSARGAIEVIRKNAELCGFAVDAHASTVEKFLRGQPHRCDLVFLDAPYDTATTRLSEQINQLAIGNWLVDGAVVIVEQSARGAALEWPPGFSEVTARRFGDTLISRAVWYVSS